MGSLQRSPSPLAGCGRAALICVEEGRKEGRAMEDRTRERRERRDTKGGEGSEGHEKEGKRNRRGDMRGP